MLGIFGHAHKLPPLSFFNLQTYDVALSLDRLNVGVDNIRHDVYLSPTFVSHTRKLVAQLLDQHAGTEDTPNTGKKKVNWAKESDHYKQLYRELMRDVLNKAKGHREIQVEYLAQMAVLKMLIEEIRVQFDLLVGRVKKAVRKTDLRAYGELDDKHKLQGTLQLVLQERDDIQRKVGLEICELWAEIEKKEIQTMHEAVFGGRSPFFTDLLNNPMIHMDQPDNEYFLISEYDVALGRRIEDPDKYETLLFFLRRLLNYVDLMDPLTKGVTVDQRLILPTLSNQEKDDINQQAYTRKMEGWIKVIENIDLLFDWQRSRALFQDMKKNKADQDKLIEQKLLIKHQKKLLDFFYRQFERNGLSPRVAALYEMQPEYLEYCPPLTPHQIAQYLLLPKSRKIIRQRLNRMKKVYGRPFSLSPLNKKIKSMEHITVAKCKAYLVRFLKAFARYHRDRRNLEMSHDAMERVNLAAEEKTVTLSRENNTLYEFLLPHEQTSEKAPITCHAVIKADVRGSTDLTFLMNERGLNPASYFSLNFFDPISAILDEYDAVKVFIEGDAIILSIFERENTPADWYCVARACGIALNILMIIQRYNEKSKKYKLPILELGIGISFLNKAPTFLFDSNNRIMISPAINQADRLSSCSKTGRRLLAKQKGPFHLYVFQTHSDKDMAGTADDLYTRYNVNGIELSPDAFAKLSREIDLKLMSTKISDESSSAFTLYTGRFPTKSGRFQRLIIREAQVPVVDPATLKTKKISSRKYFEVCTHPKLYKMARGKSG